MFARRSTLLLAILALCGCTCSSSSSDRDSETSYINTDFFVAKPYLISIIEHQRATIAEKDRIIRELNVATQANNELPETTRRFHAAHAWIIPVEAEEYGQNVQSTFPRFRL